MRNIVNHIDIIIERDQATIVTKTISGVKSSPEIYLSKSIVTDGGNYLK